MPASPEKAGMMIDMTKTITVADGDRLKVSVQIHVQTFHYDVTRYRPDGEGSYQEGEVIACGSESENEWIGLGSDIRGSRIKVCVTPGGETALSQYEIVAQFRIERASGRIDDLPDMQIAPGLASGDYECRTLQF
jgi:hypothetical protein